MKKIICFALGLLIGATGGYYLGNHLKDVADKTSVSQTESTDSYEYISDISEEDDDEHESREEVSIEITPHFSPWATLDDDVGFPVPSDELLNPDREGDYIMYDMQENGKGVLMNYYGIGMSKIIADIFVTSDYGKSWEAVGMNKLFINGALDIIYIGDTMVIVNAEDLSMNTHICISNDNGRNFEGLTKDDEETTLAYLIGESPETNLTAFPVVLSKDTENNTVLCAWCAYSYNSREVILISEHDGTTFEITKEFYRNNTLISDLIEECSW